MRSWLFVFAGAGMRRIQQLAETAGLGYVPQAGSNVTFKKVPKSEEEDQEAWGLPLK